MIFRYSTQKTYYKKLFDIAYQIVGDAAFRGFDGVLTQNSNDGLKRIGKTKGRC